MSQTQQLRLTHPILTHKQNSRLHEHRHHLLLPQHSISHILHTPTLSTGLPPPATDHLPPPPHSSVPKPRASSRCVASSRSEVVSQAIPSPSSSDESNSVIPTSDQCHNSLFHPIPPSVSPNADSTVEDDYRTHSHSTRSFEEKEGRDVLRPNELSEHSLPIMPFPITYTTDLQTGNGATAGSTDSSRSPNSDRLPSFSSFSPSSPTSLDGCRMSRESPSDTTPHYPIREGPICLTRPPFAYLYSFSSQS